MDLFTRENSERIATFLSGNMSPEEVARFHEWLEEDPARGQLLAEATLIWQAGEEETFPDFDKDVDVAWKKVTQHIQRNDTGTARVIPFAWRRWAAGIAAAFAMLALATWILVKGISPDQTPVAFVTGAGETLFLTLPDSSRVWLNERSSLSYAGDFSERRLKLEGEAFFQVRRMEHSPFTVESQGALTEVLGTSFNIRAYPGETAVELTVETGKVAFSREEAPQTRLEVAAGHSAVLRRETGLLAEPEEKIANALSWHTGKLSFQNATLEEVRLSFERYYGKKLEAEDSSVWNCHYTGAFDQATPDEVAESLAFSLSLQVSRTDSVYTLLGAGCKGR